jgi:DNA topoisomerase-1
LRQLGLADTETDVKKNMVAAVKATAQSLGNTPAVCRKSYIHPAVIEAYLDGSLIPKLNEWSSKTPSTSSRRLRPDEAAVLRFLKNGSNGRKKRAKPAN